MKSCAKCGKTYDDDVDVCPDDQTPLTTPDSDPMVGSVLAGRYLIVEPIGKGGMGTIYRAVHQMMDRQCAIKLLTAVSGADESAVARFNLEAKMASSIDNPHAVTIYDFGETDGGLLYLAMELVDGKPLSRVLQREGRLAPQRVARIISQTAEALTAAHLLGIVHRDLKPDNIMITAKSGELDYVKVLDFGIAKLVTDRGENLTKTGFVLGTPLYMSPEQLCGEKLDVRSDIYSLAIIGYQMLSGRLPFDGDNAQAIMMKRVTGDPIPLRQSAPHVSDYTEQVVMWGLSRDREARPSSAAAFSSQLADSLADSSSGSAGRVTTPVVPQSTWVESDTVIEGPNAYQTRPSQVLAAPPSSESTPATTPQPRIERTPEPESRKPSYETVPSPRKPTTRPNVDIRVGNKPFETAPRAHVSTQNRGAKLLWILGVVLTLVIGSAVTKYLLSRGGHAGFTLVVNGAPAGSEVYVNGRVLGTAGADGRFTYPELMMATATVKITHPGFAEFAEEVRGGDGAVRRLSVAMLPLETDYGGQMVLVQAGDFLMGSDRHEANERPSHSVSVPAFYIEKYEVTNGQYKKFCDATNREHPVNSFDPYYFSSSPNAPVVGVSWEDARAYAGWVGKRLPTEEEWEKAASWDSSDQKKREWPWGDVADSSLANINQKPPRFSPVGDHPSDKSPCGVFDLGGNAGEWVDSYYLPYPGNQTTDSGFGRTSRVVRGGSPISSIDQSRTTFRGNLPERMSRDEIARILVGFRCAVSANDPKFLEHLASGR
ncbi:MAG TPA: SUMF1/EgtB/PvdO family nonheme iron enzyme [Blastocatellia bacterium]|nr:SUMF1/EgtB/PvdO family nonheme iron enzyme [Blastocatellia bacterium]